MLFTGLAALLVTVAAFVSCDRREPLKIAYLGALTGKHSALGIAGRNGSLLAIEQLNEVGGINGRRVQFISFDDEQNPKLAEKLASDIERQRFGVIVGPMTSSMASALVPALGPHRLIAISPTTSTNDLTGLDDGFLRVYPPSRQVAHMLSEQVVKRIGAKRVAAIYDLSNRAHCEGWLAGFKEGIEGRGSSLCGVVTFDSTNPTAYTKLANDLLATKPDCVFILAGALDTGMLAQRLRISKPSIGLAASEWSTTDELLTSGGDYVEGLLFYQTFDRASVNPPFLAFRKAYASRFGTEPTFASVHAYEATSVVIEAFKKNPDPSFVKNTILGIGKFSGLQGEFEFDKNGDPARKLFLMTVKNGKFVRVGL
jgi:branched-chain amino acid transport system substrate-binding protein